MKCGNVGPELSAALQERDRLLEALRCADVDCRYCAHSYIDPSQCLEYCKDCLHKCPCFSCRDNSNWKWAGYKEEDAL